MSAVESTSHEESRRINEDDKRVPLRDLRGFLDGYISRRFFREFATGGNWGRALFDNRDVETTQPVGQKKFRDKSLFT